MILITVVKDISLKVHVTSIDEIFSNKIWIVQIDYICT